MIAGTGGTRLRATSLLLASCTALFGCGARSGLDAGDLEGPGPEPIAERCPPAPTEASTRQIGISGNQVVASLAIDRAGYPIIAGAFGGTMEIDGAELTAPPPGPDTPLFDNGVLPLSTRFFLARLAPEACSGFALAFPAMAEAATAIHVAADPGGDVVLAASYFGSVDFGGGDVGSKGPAA